MIRILRNRIDPNNKRNLVWRSHGRGRIEIQMPLPSKETLAKRQDYWDKKTALEDYNLDIIRIPAVPDHTMYSGCPDFVNQSTNQLTVDIKYLN